MDVERRPFVAWRQRALQFQAQLSIAHDAAQRELLAGVAVLDDECVHGAPQLYIGAPALHSCAMFRMMSAQSKVIVPAGNFDSSAKNEENTLSIASGATLHECVFSTTPSRRWPDAVAE